MNYDPNSNKLTKDKTKLTKDELGKKKVNKVINGNVKTQKKEAVTLSDIFIEKDTKSVAQYIFSDVLVPSFKRMVSEAIKSGIDMLLYGNAADVNRPTTPASKISYNRFYDGVPIREPVATEVLSPTRKETYDYNNIVLETRGDAEAVLMGMDDIIAKYETVSVADLYDLVGITGNYTDYKYGWSDIRSARVERVPNGYRIRMPKALPLD